MGSIPRTPATDDTPGTENLRARAFSPTRENEAQDPDNRNATVRQENYFKQLCVVLKRQQDWNLKVCLLSLLLFGWLCKTQQWRHAFNMPFCLAVYFITLQCHEPVWVGVVRDQQRWEDLQKYMEREKDKEALAAQGLFHHHRCVQYCISRINLATVAKNGLAHTAKAMCVGRSGAFFV